MLKRTSCLNQGFTSPHLAKGDRTLDRKTETRRIRYLVLFIHTKRPQRLLKFTYKSQLLYMQ